MYNQQALTHYGVLGMKWGRRKAESRSRSRSTDHIESRELRKKKISEMSNDEINKMNNRLRLEKQVRELNPSAYKKGEQVAKKVIAAGTTVSALYALSQTPVARSIIEKIKEGVG